MKQPFYPAEWAIRITTERPRPAPIYGNGDLLTIEAQEYYAYRRSIREGGFKNEPNQKVPSR